MRRGLFALSAACLLAAPAVAQPPALPPDTATPFPTVTAPADPAFQDALSGVMNAEEYRPGPRVWGSVEYLRWWITPENSPELIQTIPSDQAVVNGQLDPGAASRFFPSDREIKFGGFNGTRATVGFSGERFGVDVSGFWLEEQSVSGAIFSDGTPFVVARQYISAGDGTIRSLYMSLPDQYVGGADAYSEARLWGFDVNARGPFYRMFADWNHGLAGFRYFNLEESLFVKSKSDFPSGTQVLIRDDVRTRNEFYGGQIGLASRFGSYERGLGLDSVIKLALGGTRQRVDLSGSNTIISPDGFQDTVQGGLYVQPTNAGSHERTKIAMMTEYNLNLTYNFNPNWQVYFGYSLLWNSSVMRPAEAISPVINDSRVRYVADPAQSDSNEPVFVWRANDFWTQGLNVGLRLQY